MHLVVGEKASSPMAVWISFKRWSLPLLLKCFLAYLRKYGDGRRWEVMGGDGRGVGERRRWRKTVD